MKNKKMLIVGVTLLVLVAAAGAYAITTATVPPGTVQNYPGAPQDIAPKQGATVCVDKVIHNASDAVTFNLYSSGRWFSRAAWKVVNSATGADFVVQRKVGNSATGMPGSSGTLAVNREYTTYKLTPFGNNTSATLRFCQDRQ